MDTVERLQIKHIYEKKIFFFIFKHKYRKRTFNNFLNIKKIKNYHVFDLSGTIKYYFFGKPLYFFANFFKNFFKNFVFISCDARPQLNFNAINLWFGGTSYKVPDKYKDYQNNCFVFENFSKPEINLLNLYPYKPTNSKSIHKPKIVFVGSFNIQEDNLINEIWDKEKENIFNNLIIIDENSFWEKYGLSKNKRLQYYYIQLKERLRLNIIIKIKEMFNKNLVIVGSKWQKYIPDATNDEYDFLKIKKLYAGNICLDFGSKWGSNIIYPRAVEIIENGGLLVQSIQINSSNEIYKSGVLNKFNSLGDLKNILHNLLNDNDHLNKQLLDQYSFFNDNEQNYLTFTKIYDIATQKK